MCVLRYFTRARCRRPAQTRKQHSVGKIVSLAKKTARLLLFGRTLLLFGRQYLWTIRRDADLRINRKRARSRTNAAQLGPSDAPARGRAAQRCGARRRRSLLDAPVAKDRCCFGGAVVSRRGGLVDCVSVRKPAERIERVRCAARCVFCKPCRTSGRWPPQSDASPARLLRGASDQLDRRAALPLRSSSGGWSDDSAPAARTRLWGGRGAGFKRRALRGVGVGKQSGVGGSRPVDFLCPSSRRPGSALSPAAGAARPLAAPHRCRAPPPPQSSHNKETSPWEGTDRASCPGTPTPSFDTPRAE